MGWLFDCFRIKNGRDDGEVYSRSKINEEKSVSKNQLSAVFMREDLVNGNSLEKIEDKKPLEISSTDSPDSPEREDKPVEEKETPDNTKEENTPIISESITNPFIDKYILNQTPISPISTHESPPLSVNTNTGTGTGTDIEILVPSLSDWLKPPSKERRCVNSGLSTDSDRPIIGSVAAHWSEESESISVPLPKPKTWDGKGIPNSTTKYKEDQKVSYHATPFEERLEKALSEEKSQRGIPVLLELNSEGEESDTAAS